MSIEKLFVHFRTQPSSYDIQISTQIDELINQLDQLKVSLSFFAQYLFISIIFCHFDSSFVAWHQNKMNKESQTLDKCIDQYDEYGSNMHKLRNVLSNAEQQLRLLSSPSLTAEDQKKQVEQQAVSCNLPSSSTMDASQMDLRMLMGLKMNLIHFVDVVDMI